MDGGMGATDSLLYIDLITTLTSDIDIGAGIVGVFLQRVEVKVLGQLGADVEVVGAVRAVSGSRGSTGTPGAGGPHCTWHRPHLRALPPGIGRQRHSRGLVADTDRLVDRCTHTGLASLLVVHEAAVQCIALQCSLVPCLSLLFPSECFLGIPLISLCLSACLLACLT